MCRHDSRHMITSMLCRRWFAVLPKVNAVLTVFVKPTQPCVPILLDMLLFGVRPTSPPTGFCALNY